MSSNKHKIEPTWSHLDEYLSCHGINKSISRYEERKHFIDYIYLKYPALTTDNSGLYLKWPYSNRDQTYIVLVGCFFLLIVLIAGHRDFSLTLDKMHLGDRIYDQNEPI